MAKAVSKDSTLNPTSPQTGVDQWPSAALLDHLKDTLNWRTAFGAQHGSVPPAVSGKTLSGVKSYFVRFDDSTIDTLIAAGLRELLIRINSVCDITGLSVPTIYRLIAKQTFPRPVKITASARAWKLSEVVAWVESRERTEA
jgi:prophage regulatory protein